MKWSPDQETVAIVTGNQTLLCMNTMWEPLAEVPLEELDATALVSLAWRGDGQYLACRCARGTVLCIRPAMVHIA